jgi:hypothetical protein
LATAFKLQVGLPFAAYFLLRRKGALFVPAALTFAMVGLVSIAWMTASGVSWLAGWSANLAHLARPGGLNDPSLLNPDRTSLIDLEYLFQTVAPGGQSLGVLALALTGMAAVTLLAWTDDSEPSWIAISGIAILSLLAVYHRYYDAVLLAIPVAWGLSVFGTAASRIGLAVIVLAADFLLPFQTGLNAIAKSGLLPTWLTSSPLWTPVALSQHVWALVAIACVLLYAAMRERQRVRPTGTPLSDGHQVAAP